MKLEAQALARREAIPASELATAQDELAARRALERAEAERLRAMRELEQKQRALEDEARAVQRELDGVSAGTRDRAVGQAIDRLAHELDQQLAALQGMPHDAGEQADVARQIARLEAALAVLRGEAIAPSRQTTPRPSPKP